MTKSNKPKILLAKDDPSTKAPKNKSTGPGAGRPDHHSLEAKPIAGGDKVNPSSSSNTNKNSKPKVLLAEDDKFICRAYRDGLSRAGFEVILTSDGVETCKKLQEEKLDLVLLDIIMPNKSGFEVLEELKLNGSLKSIPIIILSNLGQASDIKKGKELGAVDYLIKSNFSMKQVIAKVKEHLAKARK